MKQQKFVKLLTYFYMLPLALMCVFNSANSLLRTTYFDLYQEVEAARYKWDNPLLVLLLTAGVFVLLYFLRSSKWFRNADITKTAVLFGGILSLVIVLLFRCIATCDSASLSDIAIEFSKGNYQAFEQGEYLYRYSFQLGMVALLELIYRIFGIENFIVFQILNVISIMIFIWMLNRITSELFEDERVGRMEAVLSLGMLPLFLFSTFVYGDIIGWAFGVSAVFWVIRYLKTDKWTELLKAAFLLMAGVIVKSNINILVVAAVIAVILNCIRKKQYRMLIMVPVIVILSQAGVYAVNSVYVQRAGLDEYPAGIPKIAWIAMSMQEADEGGYACGWYNGYNWAVYGDNDYDRELTTEACIENLKQSLNKFAHEQKYAVDFFYKKFTSQWNSPTFQAMITNEWSSRHVENLSAVAEFFIYGAGRNLLYGIMNIYHFLIFLCTAACFFFERKNWSLEKAFFTLNIFGGFLFHMIWEAQSRYVLGYFVLMLPIAACGCVKLLDGAEKLAMKFIRK